MILMPGLDADVAAAPAQDAGVDVHVVGKHDCSDEDVVRGSAFPLDTENTERTQGENEDRLLTPSRVREGKPGIPSAIYESLD